MLKRITHLGFTRNPRHAWHTILMKNQQQSAEQKAGERIRDLRVSNGLSQQQLADAMTELGFPWQQTTVAKTEAAARPIRVNEVAALASIFGTDASSFIPVDGQSHAMLEMVRARSRASELGDRIRALEAEADELRQQEKHWRAEARRWSKEWEARRGEH